MYPLEGIRSKLSDMLGKWSEVENKQRLYGFDTLQAGDSRNELLQIFEQVLTIIPEFSLVKKEDDIEIVGKDWGFLGSALQPKALTSCLKEKLENLRVNSISFCCGLLSQELEEFLYGFNLPTEKLEELNGLQGYLKGKNIINIKIDQMRFKLLKEDEDISIFDEGKKQTTEEIDILYKSGADTEDKINTKEFSFFWKKYLRNEIDADSFKRGQKDFIRLAKRKPSELLKVFKSINKDQNDITAFLSGIAGKMFEIGFTPKEINNIEKKLSKPKRIMIAEDDLGRLRQIEKKFLALSKKKDISGEEDLETINQQLTDDKERIDTLLRQNSQGVIVVDKEGSILSFNTFAERALGVSLKDNQQVKLKDLIRKGRMLAITANLQDETIDFMPKKIEVIAPEPAIRDIISESSAVVENEEGKTVGMLSSLHNVVEIEQMEKHRNEIMDMLSHDLRAPICAAKQSLSVLMDMENFVEGLDDQSKRLIHLSQKNIERLESLVSTVMDVRQLETGKIILRKDSVDISRLLEDSVSSLKPWVEDKNIKMTVNIPDMPEIEADADRIYQVVTNLISNALKFTSAGGSVKIEANVEQQDSGDFVRISVIDSGIGIKDEDLEKVFKKYEQISLKQPKGMSGLGLGLAICRAIIELHGGKIWAESQEGKGSKLIFILPYKSK